MRRLLMTACVGLVLTAPCLMGQAGAPAGSDPDADLQRVLTDYVRLYQKDTLAEWRGLFLPGFVAASTNDDGSVTTRTLEEFYERQRKYFATGRSIREELRNVRTSIDGRLASAHADFVLFDNGSESTGRLVLTFIRDSGRFRIHSLAFTYHLDQPGTSR